MKLFLALGLAGVCSMALASDGAKALYDQAVILESTGKVAEAVKLYRQAARAGSADAAKRLNEIFQRTGSGPRKPLIGDFPTPRERERDTGIKR